MFKDEYNAMFVEDHTEERNQPCPSELARTKILKYDGVECKVYYNYVPSYTYGIVPMNCWWGFAEKDGCVWTCPLRDEIKTLEEACKVIQPVFETVIKRWKKKRGAA